VADQHDTVDRIEVASAIVLSIAALASSWATYQASLWDGEQAAHYSETNSLRTQASRAAIEGDALASVELRMFEGWLEAKARNEEGLAAFYQARFPNSFKPAFNAWLADRPLTNPSAPQSPFVTPTYRRPGKAAADALDTMAEETFQKGQLANHVSDAFQQSATMLAVALFFGGIGQVFRQRGTRIALLTVAGVALVTGLLRMFSLPIQVLGVHALK
jgi:hypothetical protein